jgi:superfamily II DNA or RNA helicase
MRVIECDYTDDERSKQAAVMDTIKKKNLDIITVKDTPLVSLTFCQDKLAKIIAEINSNKALKQIIYTNYTSENIPKLERALAESGITHYTISGQQSFEERRSIQDQINKSEDPCVVILSSVGSEGLSFINMRIVHIVEPYWYYGRISQIIYRAVRNNSHKTLPPD